MSAESPNNEFKPAAMPSKEARRYLGNMGQTKFYEEIKSGRLQTRKIGRKRVVLVDDADAYLRSLPTE